MTRQKLTVAIAPELAGFVEEYRTRHGLGNQSIVIERALQLLTERELELAYAAASKESDSAWDVTSADGLTD